MQIAVNWDCIVHNVLREDMCWVLIEETNIRTEEDISNNVYDYY
jgi:hypothetical protein